jgi:hypothetical protein
MAYQAKREKQGGLPARQADVVRAVYHLTSKLKRPPSHREVGVRAGMVQQQVIQVLNALESKGVVRREAYVPRTLELAGASWGASEHGNVYAADMGTAEGRRLALVLASGGKAA